MSDEQFENELKKVKFFDERKPGERYRFGVYSFILNGEENEMQVIVDYGEKIIHKNLLSITERLNAQHNLNEQSKRYGNGLEFTIRKLEKENEKLKIALSEYGVDFSSLDRFKEAIGYNEMVKKEEQECYNCYWHTYDWFDDGDEFEVCSKGNEIRNKQCKDFLDFDEGDEDEETEVRECSDCGEFMTEYHEWDCSGTWTAEDYCNAGHDLEDINPNSCKDYWDKI